MKLALAFVSAFLLVLPVSPFAAQVDCEPARCAVQQGINDQCPCDLSGQTNHGQHVSCVAHVVKDLARQSAIPTNCKGKIKRCAAHSICGKPGFVTCQIPTDTCTSGTCARNPTLTCLTDFDCGTRCKTQSSAERCTAARGMVGTSSTCCADCAP